MNALANDIRNFISERVQSASAADLPGIMTALCANDSAPRVVTAAIQPRFTKLNAEGRPVDDSSTEWCAVYHADAKLTWSRGLLDCGEVNWDSAKKAAAALRTFGKDDWRLPTVKEYQSILDYSRFAPALDTNYFSKDTGWCWTSTADASGPSDVAWFVNLLLGSVSRYDQANRCSVRAVRAGQNLSLEI